MSYYKNINLDSCRNKNLIGRNVVNMLFPPVVKPIMSVLKNTIVSQNTQMLDLLRYCISISN